MNNFETVLKNLQEIERLESEIVALKAKNSELLVDVRKERGQTFQVNGKHYSIRTRAGNNFLVSSDVAFGSWLKKDKEA